MASKLKLDKLSQEVLDVLRNHGLTPEGFVVSITMAGKDFDIIANGHPDRVHPEMIQRDGENNNIQWSLQILRRRALEDFPRGAMLDPPPDE